MTVKVAKEKLLSQIELYQDQENHLHKFNDADPAVVGVSEDKGLPLTSQLLNKQEL